MANKRVAAFVLLLVLLVSIVLPPASDTDYLPNHFSANAALAEQPAATEAAPASPVNAILETALQTNLLVPQPSIEPTSASPQLSLPSEPATAAPVLAQPTAAADIPSETLMTSAAPIQTPALLGPLASLQVTAAGDDSVAGSVLVLQLEAIHTNGLWEPVPDPALPEQIYQLTLTLDASGNAEGAFALEGLSATQRYQARVLYASAATPGQLAFDYDDQTSEEEQYQTTVHIGFVPPAIESTEPTLAPEPTPVPVQTYGADDLYTVSVTLAETLDFDALPLRFTLYQSNEGTDTFVASLSLPLQDGYYPADSFSLAGIPSDLPLRAVCIAYGNENLTFAPSDDHGTWTAVSQELLFTATYGNQSLQLHIANPPPEPTPAAIAPAAQSPVAPSSLARAQQFSLVPDPYATELDLNLSLALNGLAPALLPVHLLLQEDAETGAYTCSAPDYDETTIGVSITAAEENVVINLTPVVPLGDPLLRYTVTLNPKTLAYTVSQTASGYDASLTTASGSFSAGVTTVQASAAALTGYVAFVNWNDGKSASRPTATYSLTADGAVLNPQPVKTEEVLNYSLTQYTYTDLPKYHQGTPIEYATTQSMLAGYQTSTSGNTITNTLQSSLTVHLQWNDASVKDFTRPSAADCQVHFIFKREARRTGSSVETLPLPSGTWTFAENVWSYTIGALPAFDEDGYPYDYLIYQDDVAPAASGYGEYVTTVRNIGVYAGQTAANTAYQGGTLINTITDTTGFSFDKHWKDDENTSERPANVRFYLYRFPENTSYSFESLSPVSGFDSKLLTSLATDANIVYATESDLPRYDTKGNTYVYYLRESMSNPGDYQIQIDNPDSSVTNFILPGADVTNIRKAEIAIPFTVTWHAKAVQSMEGGITAVLQRKLASAPESDWADINTQTVTGFRAETMAITSRFSGMPKYDENGARYEYRVQEIGATIHATGGTVPANNISDGQFTVDGYTFVVTQPAPNDSSNHIENRLVGTTPYRVIKQWSPALAAETAAAISIQILQDGNATWDNNAVVLPNGATHESGAQYRLTGTGVLNMLFDKLPKYDVDGREYTYTVRETAVHQPSEYQLSNITYSKDANTVPTATITNTTAGGTGMVFRINKIWLDDGDTLGRVPVNFGLYHIANGQYTLVASRQLTAAEAWTGLLGYTPPSEELADYSQYVIREIDSSGLDVMDLNASGEHSDPTSTYLNNGSGTAQTTTQRYQVTTDASSQGQTYTISNLRIGKLNIAIKKDWYINDLQDLNLVADFALYRDGSSYMETKSLAEGSPSLTFSGLDKYDSVGAIIPYSVREISLTPEDGDVMIFDNGRIQLEIEDEFVLSSATAEQYVIGVPLGTADSMGYTFTNRLTGSNSLTINTVWRDAGTGEPRRPDIQLSLYRYTDLAAEPAKLVATQRLWNTSISANKWVWTCDFGSYNKFDENGNRYHYYVVENMLQTSDYQISYYSNTDAGSIIPNPAATTTSSTFPIQPGEGLYAYAISTFNPNTTGTIINTLTDKLDVERKKIWLNLPSWFNQSNLPTVKFQLYRTLIPLDQPTTNEEAVQHNQSDWIETLPGGTGSAIFRDAPVYNEYGLRYYYYVAELTESNIPFNVDWYTTTYDREQGNVTNAYTPYRSTISLSLQKQWDFVSRTADQTTYPATSYVVYQRWESGAQHHDRVVKTVQISGGSIADLINSALPAEIIDKDSSNNPLPRYAPDGSAFIYYAIEAQLPGYATLPANFTAFAEWNDEHTIGTIDFANTYTPNESASLTAYKLWNDQGNKFGTRPAFSADTPSVQYTLWRKAGNLPGQEVPAALITGTTWQLDGTNANRWICTFTGQFAQYATSGQRYTYYVTEVLPTGYSQSYFLTAGAGTLTLTNTLSRINVLLTKQWKTNDDAIFTKEQLEHLYNLGAMPLSITFEIRCYNSVTEAWEPLSSDSQYEVSWTQLLDYALNGKYLVVGEPLPRFKTGTDEPLQYRVYEKTLHFADGDLDPADAGFVVTNNHTPNNRTAITNSMGVRKLYFVKNWDDDTNRDGMRPQSLTLTVASTQDSSQTTTVVLTPQSTSSDPSTDAAHTALINRWRGELTVPLGGTYTVTEEVIASYTQGLLLTETDWWSFTNSRNVKLVSVSASKSWAKDAAWIASTRPSSVTFWLEYKASADSAWVDLRTVPESPDETVALPYGADASIMLTADSDTAWSSAVALWENLPAYVHRNDPSTAAVLMQYRVREESVNGYTTTYAPAQVSYNAQTGTDELATTITNTLQVIAVSGKKIWSDSGNLYSRRPATLALSIEADGFPLSPQPALSLSTVGNEWSYSYVDLPRYQKGTQVPIVYQVREEAVKGYSIVVGPTAKGTVNLSTGNVTNANFENKLITIQISGTKTWMDDQNHYGMRPTNITLSLRDGATAITPQPTPTWTKNGITWTYTYTGLPRYYAASDTPVPYHVVEIAVAGYAPQTDTTALHTINDITGNITEANFTNTLITVSLQGSKVWSDYQNAFGMRPDSLTLRLLYNNTTTALSPQPTPQWEQNADTWTYRYTGLPKYNKGTNTVTNYFVEETPANGYTASAAIATTTADGNGSLTATTITNTLQTVSLSGQKNWSDQNNLYARRPGAIDITVLADGQPATLLPNSLSWNRSVVPWTFIATPLPRYQKGTQTPISYSVRETAVNGYTTTPGLTVTGSPDMSTGNIINANFTNTLVTVSVGGQKQWADQSNRYLTRPSSVTLTLMADGHELLPQPAPAWTKPVGSNTWTFTYANLPRYREDNVTPITYTVLESPVNGYTRSSTVAVGGSSDSSGNIADILLTNTLITISIQGSKTWEDDSNHYAMRPDNLVLTVLQGDVTPVAIAVQPASIQWQKPGNRWTYEITGLPRYAAGTLTEIRYAVEETPASGYTAQGATLVRGTVSSETGNITLVDFTNVLARVSITGSKHWVDSDNFYRFRPDDISITLLAGSDALVPQPNFTWEKDDNNEWHFTATALPRYKKNSTDPILYSISEAPVAGYLPATGITGATGSLDGAGNVSGITLTNTLATVSISGRKAWQDTDDRYHRRPTSLQLTLLAGGVSFTPAIPVTWNAGGDPWAFQYTGLPRYQKGTTSPISYTVQEEIVSGYRANPGRIATGTADSTTGNVTGALLTNALETVSLSGTKTWEDQSNHYLTRPDSLTLTLMAGTEAMVDPPTPVLVQPEGSNSWTYTFSGLPRYQPDGTTPITYGLVEAPIYGYIATPATQTAGSVDGSGNITLADFTNTLDTISITGTKTWKDLDNFFETRPTDLTLILWADDEKVTQTLDIDWSVGENSWTYTISGLPRYNKSTGLPILYSVDEVTPADYLPLHDTPVGGDIDLASGNVTAADMTNQLATISIDGQKTWEDVSNRYHKRPDSITLAVLANGHAIDTPDIRWETVGNVWHYHIDALPKYLKGTATPIHYVVSETPIPGYTADALTTSGIEDDDGNITGASFTNRMGTISISGTKHWADDSNRYLTRPDAIELLVLADGSALDPQPTILFTHDGDSWNYTVGSLPRYRNGSDSPILYTVSEAATIGYAVDGSSTTGGSVQENGSIINADFTNELVTVSLSGEKIWDDWDNYHQVRPTGVELTLLADGTPVQPAPAIIWVQPADASVWSFSVSGLPRYNPVSGLAINYTVRETPVPDYLAVDDQSGQVDSATSNITQVQFSNRLRSELEIANTTINAANGKTNAGGFVAINAAPTLIRDLDPYQPKAVNARWGAEENWQVTTQFTVVYRPFGLEESEPWVTIYVPYDDLSALTQVSYFQDAALHYADGVYTLTLSTDAMTMPAQTRILVSYEPTIATYNLTAGHLGGRVSVITPSCEMDGRYCNTLSQAYADSGRAIDMRKISIRIPQADKDGIARLSIPGIAHAMAAPALDSEWQTIKSDAKGRFAITLSASLGGETLPVPVNGTIKVLGLDQLGNPSSVSVTLDQLEMPLDVGYVFVESTSVPKTGDPILVTTAVFAISGLMLILLRRKKVKQR